MTRNTIDPTVNHYSVTLSHYFFAVALEIDIPFPQDHRLLRILVTETSTGRGFELWRQ
jgi:hypothetical protein